MTINQPHSWIYEQKINNTCINYNEENNTFYVIGGSSIAPIASYDQIGNRVIVDEVWLKQKLTQHLNDLQGMRDVSDDEKTATVIIDTLSIFACALNSRTAIYDRYRSYEYNTETSELIASDLTLNPIGPSDIQECIDLERRLDPMTCDGKMKFTLAQLEKTLLEHKYEISQSVEEYERLHMAFNPTAVHQMADYMTCRNTEPLAVCTVPDPKTQMPNPSYVVLAQLCDTPFGLERVSITASWDAGQVLRAAFAHFNDFQL